LGIELLGETLGVEAWKALPPDTSGPVFWKGCLRTALGPETLALIREAEALRDLDSPGLVKPIIDATRHDRPYLVFPWIRGQVHANRPRGYSTSQILGMLRESAEILFRVHKKGWIHGDIRPENLFWSCEGMKIIDFGMAHRKGEAVDAPPTHSPEFLSPETQLSPYHWEPPADWYSLGKTAFRWLGRSTGTRQAGPGEKETTETSRRSRTHEGGPPGFWDWMTNWIQPDPALRPKASHLVNSLLDWEIRWLVYGD